MDTTAADAGSTDKTPSTTIAEYTPDTGVKEHSQIDKDILRMGKLLSVEDYVHAHDVYANGKNSVKSSGNRKLKSLSAGASSMGFKEALTFAAYYGGDAEYANNFIEPIILGTGDFGAASAIARQEMATKGTQYVTMYMYVLRELYDAVDDCKAQDQADNTDDVHAWDEGWAFYAGSLEGTDGTGKGEILHALAEKRASNYNPANDVNADLLAMFKEGKDLLNDAHGDMTKCDSVAALIPNMVAKMNVPLLQGAMRYAHKMTAAVGGGDKEAAEGWAFATAILPLIDECNSGAAATIKKNQEFGIASPMADDEETVFMAYQSVFECLGVTCDDIGELAGAPECSLFSDTLDAGGDAAGVKAGVIGIVAAVVAGFAMF